MHFRAPRRNLALTVLLSTGVTSCNEDYPPDGSTDFAGEDGDDGDNDGDDAADTVTGRGGSGSEEPVEPDGVANDAGTR
jgi:hypothetical protein